MTLVTTDFYATLPPILSADALTDPRHFREAPDDWMIVVTDVTGSTAAIAAGRYKEVNTLGAASIISAQNAAVGIDFPFVFGGDGATLVIPPVAAPAISNALNFLKAKAQQDFGLTLRVGCVPVASVRARGKQVLVARCELSPGNAIALFAGGGLNEATAMVKQPDGRYLLTDAPTARGDVQGLECRWCAVPARADGMLSLIIHAPGENLALYRELLARLREIAPDARPVTPQNIPVRWPPEFLMHEAKIKHDGWLRQRLHYLGVALLTALLTVLVRLTRHQPDSAAARYVAQLSLNTDYLKLDDMLRMVIDISASQRERITSLLEDYRQRHQVQWGAHFSPAAIFTCMVRSPEVHLHFVDGSDGGYTAAARDLDARRAASTLSTESRDD